MYLTMQIPRREPAAAATMLNDLNVNHITLNTVHSENDNSLYFLPSIDFP